MSEPDMLTIAVESVAGAVADKKIPMASLDLITEARITVYVVTAEDAARHNTRPHLFSMVHLVMRFLTAHGAEWYPAEQAVTA